MWKKKVAAALAMTFLSGSLTFGSTASAYIINVGMEDLAAQEKAADSGRKQEKKAENAKEHGNAKDEKKKEVKDFQEKKAETSVKKEDKKAENSDTKKAMEEASKASVTPAPQKREEGQKPLVLNKKKEEMKPSVQKKADESKIPLQGKKTEAAQESTDAVKTKNKKSKEKDRFQEIFRDESFIYYMDMRSVRNVPIPNRQDRMIDVWVKLKPNSFSDDEDAKAGKYYLEHYYLNPKSKQIQFLCELEVTGRPSNAIKERPYSSQNWENLVPGSVEDDIYHAVVKKAKSSSGVGGVAIPSASDVLDMLNIGL